MTSANREQEKDGGSGLEPTQEMIEDAKLHCPRHRQLRGARKGFRCNCADLLAFARRYQAQAPAIEAVVEAYSRALTAVFENQFRTAWDVLAPHLAALAAVRGGPK